jgi:Tol biopolymer transport system component
VYVTDADGSNPRQVLKTKSPSISWSADSQFIAAVIGGDVYKVNIEGKQKLVRLTNNKAAATHIGWSPDGKHIAFFLDEYGIHPRLYVVDSDGKNRRQIVADLPENQEPYSYMWSPDSSYIAIMPNFASNANVFVVDAKSWNVKSLGLQPGKCIWARPSPDGDHILCRSGYGVEPGGYTVVTLSTGDSHPVGDVLGTYVVMDWSPDGKQIALSGGNDIVIVDADGSNRRWLPATVELGELDDLIWGSAASPGQDKWH